MSSLSKIDKERILKALEEDREFRYALMGLLGFKEILDRITSLEEGFKKLYERQQKLEERFAKLEERFVRLEERQQKLEERFMNLEERQQRLEERYQKLEERFARIEERQQRLEEEFKKLAERQQRLEERQQKLEERLLRVELRLEDLHKAVVTIGNRFGVLVDEVFRKSLSGILSKYFGAEAKRWTYLDRDGIVYGYESIVEVDVVIKYNVHILVEVKSRADAGDIIELVRIGKLYEKVNGVKPKLAIVTGYVSKKAREVALRHSVEIYSYLEEGGQGSELTLT